MRAELKQKLTRFLLLTGDLLGSLGDLSGTSLGLLNRLHDTDGNGLPH